MTKGSGSSPPKSKEERPSVDNRDKGSDDGDAGEEEAEEAGQEEEEEEEEEEGSRVASRIMDTPVMMRIKPTHHSIVNCSERNNLPTMPANIKDNAFVDTTTDSVAPASFAMRK